MAGEYSYSKRPLWQWILLYVILGLIVYGLIYYFVFAKKGGYVTQTASQYASPTSTSAPSGNIYMIRTDAAKGSYLVDFAGMTLYTYDKDANGVSNCYNGCAAAWPPYTSGATAEKTLPENITVITRTDGSKQFAWKGMPLYYYATDTKPGDITGDGVGGVWHIIKP
ncbi:MAG TPA: hypothetical protein VLB73_01070 [Patescibacteria group bacterium]|nr:hypothetical protein [Patescibacteria group bacterium]